MPVILICTLLFVVWFHYENRKSSKYSSQKSEAFWKREQAANFARKKDLSTLDYITVPIKNLPFSKNCSEEISKLQDVIYSLAEKKIVKLTGLTNTDIKEAYGLANFNILSEYDSNYDNLIITLNSWGKLLFDENRLPEARTVLEYALDCGSDIKATYITLANIYAENHLPEKLDELIEHAGTIDTFTKNTVVNTLKNIRSDYILSEAQAE